MKLKLKNVGIINNADVNINGLTVITGENGSGKTTVGKALFALLDSVENIDKKALNDKRNFINKEIQKILSLQELIAQSCQSACTARKNLMILLLLRKEKQALTMC